jgi:uncharacterized protein (TIGR02646 family)
MRALAKGPMPAILVANGDTWRDELVAVLAAGEKPTDAMKARYRHPEIKDAILTETGEKCAYCESKVRHIAYGDIEHFIPKSKAPDKAYVWSNLTLACDICNTNKGDYYSDDPTKSQDDLIDPYVDNPRDHFLFMREVVSPRPDSLRGYATEQVLKLTRGELLERRRERMAFIDGMVMAYTLAEPAYKSVVLATLYDNHLKDDDEYAGIVGAYIEHLQSLGTLPPT